MDKTIIIGIVFLCVCISLSIGVGVGVYLNNTPSETSTTTTPTESTTAAPTTTSTSAAPTNTSTSAAPTTASTPASPPATPSEPIGTPVNCTSNDVGKGAGAIYRVTGDKKLQWYPNPEIASSWDPAWGSFKRINCAGYTLGSDMALKAGVIQKLSGMYSIKGGKNNKFCADEGGRIICNRDNIGAWEKFNITNIDNDFYSIKGGKDNKLCADEGGTIVCNRTNVGAREKFKIVKDGDNYTIRGGNANKLCADDDVNVICNRDNVDDWEKFKITPI